MLFKKKLNNDKVDSRHEQTAKRIATRILSVQVQVASYLNKKTAHYTKFQKQLLLLLVSLFFSGVSLILIFKSIF